MAKVSVGNTNKRGAPKKKVSPKPSPEIVVEKEEKIEVPDGYILTEPGTYVAKRKCFFGITLYYKGRRFEAMGGELIPHHFEKEKK